MAVLTGRVTDSTGNTVTRDVQVTVDGNAPATWGAGILQWIQPLPSSMGNVSFASPTDPWQTIANNLKPGETLFLRPGVYNAKGTSFTWTAVGTATAPVTISGIIGVAPPVFQGRMTMMGPWQRWARTLFDGPTGNVGGPGPNGEANLVNVGVHTELSNCEVRGAQWHAGVSASDADDYRVLNCYIHDNGGLNGDYRTSDAQWNTSHGGYISPSAFGLIGNCVVEHNDAKGIMGRHSSNHILLVHNTIVANGRHGSEAYESSHDWVWANNIVLNNGNVKGGVGISMGGTGGATYLQRRNVLFHNNTNGTGNWSGTGTVSENKVADPKCVRPAVYTDHQDAAPSWDHRLLAGSPAIGYADPFYALPFDILGVARGAAPDCGAYQFV